MHTMNALKEAFFLLFVTGFKVNPTMDVYEDDHITGD